MLWEELTMPEFAAARDETGVCLLGVGCLERHGNHLPLGTDYINVRELCRKAAEIEPAVVFPPYYFGQIMEARCFPGTVALDPELLLKLTFAVLDEIGRNGFKKIIIVNGHGGNCGFLEYVLRSTQYRKRPYLLYLFDLDKYLSPEQRERAREMQEEPEGGHADEMETSVTMANSPELVKMEQVMSDEVGRTNSRLKPVMDAFTKTPFNWYSMHPEHYAGPARHASPEKGEKFMEWFAENLANAIRAAKADELSEKLRDEFFKREAELRGK